MNDLPEKLGNMAPNMTVSELIQRLAGLPPMMEVMADVANANMFVNGTKIIEGSDSRSPFVTLDISYYPRKREPDNSSVEEQTDRQRQRAMDMSAQIERETQMHRMVE